MSREEGISPQTQTLARFGRKAGLRLFAVAASPGFHSIPVVRIVDADKIVATTPPIYKASVAQPIKDGVF